jgi:hypothetical protein
MKYETLLYNIKNNISFAFSRWGDGEWLNVNKFNGKNCDGNIYYSDLGDELKKIVSVKQYYHMGVQTYIQYSVNESMKYTQDWTDADVLHRASINGTLYDFISLLNTVHVVYVGNESLKKLEFIDEFIEIPYNNCWLSRNEIIDRIKNTFVENTHKVYLFSAGMVSNVFVDRLWKLNNTNTYIDVGSVFDPYVGRTTRSYHKLLKIKNEQN